MLMRQQIRTPIWPYVVVVLCLFLLSVLASQTWRSGHITTASLAPFRVSSSTDGKSASASNHINPDHANESVVQIANPSSQAADDSSVLELNSPFPTESPRHVANVTPGVGERITLDYSIKDSPALPTFQQIPVAPSTSTISESAAEPQAEPAIPLESIVREIETVPNVVAPPVDANRIFPRSVLSTEYEQLAVHSLCRAWSQQGLQILDQIYQADSLTAPETTKLLHQLTNHAQQANRLAEQTSSLSLRADIMRVGFATLRRTELWLQIQKIIATGGEQISSVKTANIAPALAAVEQRFRETSHSQDWRKYLLLDEVTQLSRNGDAGLCRQTARRVLRRMDSPKLSEKQVEVFQNPPFDAFSRELRQWANESIDYVQLLADIESYERTRSTGDAGPIASSYDMLRWSNHPEVQKFTDLLNVHYRNSNVRVALTSEFLNRMLPDPQQFQEDIVDNISGADVYGTTRTLNQLQVVLVPDGNSWRIGLEAHGEVASDTAASKGPATFYNQGHARYHARKLLLIDRRGIRVWRAEATATVKPS